MRWSRTGSWIVCVSAVGVLLGSVLAGCGRPDDPLPPAAVSTQRHALGACGNGVVESGEACDVGELNGTVASCCSSACTLAAANGAACPGGLCQLGMCLVHRLASDTTWRAQPFYWDYEYWLPDTTGWPAATDEGRYGGAPWGTAASFPGDTAAHWLWSYDSRWGGDYNIPVVSRTFYPVLSSAVLSIAVDEHYEVYLNGACVGDCYYPPGSPPAVIPVTLNPGVANTISIIAESLTDNTGGVLFDLRETGCGNQVVEPGEQCDTGEWNGTAGSCCSATCQLTAGDGAACVGGVCQAGACLVTRLASDATWRAVASYEDAGDYSLPDTTWWPAAVDEGGYGGAPWGTAASFPGDTQAHWIWSYDSRWGGEYNIPVVSRTFYPALSSAVLSIAVDEHYEVYVNGQCVGDCYYYSDNTTAVIPVTLNPGVVNTISIIAESMADNTGGVLLDLRAPGCGNQVVEAGEQCDVGTLNGTAESCCSATCQLTAANGTGCPGGTCQAGVCLVTELSSDASWRAYSPYYDYLDWDTWTLLPPDTTGWPAAVDEGAYGGAPWGSAAQLPGDTSAHWIWSFDSRGNTGYEYPILSRTFYPAFSAAVVSLAADEYAELYVDGEYKGYHYPGYHDEATVIPLTLKAGVANTISILADAWSDGIGGVVMDLRPAGCGNLVVEPGELCDFGALNGVLSCCSGGCQTASQGTTCRAAAGPCDAAEVCTGVSTVCPPDVFRPAGAVCDSWAGVLCPGTGPDCPGGTVDVGEASFVEVCP